MALVSAGFVKQIVLPF